MIEEHAGDLDPAVCAELLHAVPCITTARPREPPRRPCSTTRTSSTRRPQPVPSATTEADVVAVARARRRAAAGASVTSSAGLRRDAWPSSPCSRSPRRSAWSARCSGCCSRGSRFRASKSCFRAVAAGAAGLVGLGALYRGLAVGAMGIVAPISAASPVVRLAVDAAQGTSRRRRCSGSASHSCLPGSSTLSREPRPRAAPRVAAASGSRSWRPSASGCSSSGSTPASDESAAWAVVAARIDLCCVALVAALVLAHVAPPRTADLAAARRVGVFDTVANVLVAIAADHGAGRHRRRAERACIPW